MHETGGAHRRGVSIARRPRDVRAAEHTTSGIAHSGGELRLLPDSERERVGRESDTGGHLGQDGDRGEARHPLYTGGYTHRARLDAGDGAIFRDHSHLGVLAGPEDGPVSELLSAIVHGYGGEGDGSADGHRVRGG